MPRSPHDPRREQGGEERDVSRFDSDSLGDRMKEYESVPRTSLVRRVPVMMRLDGKSFHTFTRELRRPYDDRFHVCMWAAAKALCEQVQGCKLAYVQSDEITLLLTDWDNLTTEPWFGYEVQKMCSVGAAICTMAFNAALQGAFVHGPEDPKPEATFDCRVWNVPESEVANVFIWRQQDATRNSIQMLAQSHFSPKRLHGLNCDQLQDLLVNEERINWNDCPVCQKRGVCLRRKVYETTVRDALGPDKLAELGDKVKDPDEKVIRSVWRVDYETPIFTQQREYITDLLPKRGML